MSQGNETRLLKFIGSTVVDRRSTTDSFNNIENEYMKGVIFTLGTEYCPRHYVMLTVYYVPITMSFAYTASLA